MGGGGSFVAFASFRGINTQPWGWPTGMGSWGETPTGQADPGMPRHSADVGTLSESCTASLLQTSLTTAQTHGCTQLWGTWGHQVSKYAFQGRPTDSSAEGQEVWVRGSEASWAAVVSAVGRREEGLRVAGLRDGLPKIGMLVIRRWW